MVKFKKEHEYTGNNTVYFITIISLVLQEHIVNNEVTKGGIREVGRNQVTVGPTRLIWRFDFTVT